jgi:hypothetical protein
MRYFRCSSLWLAPQSPLHTHRKVCQARLSTICPRYRATIIPVIERKFHTNSDRRVLFGQSRGGSFVLYSAFTDPDLFWGRIASNPAFKPDGDRFFGEAPVATRHDLGLVVTSGTRDRPQSREGALKWFRHWEGETGGPWAIKTVSIEGGTHAADSANSYRAGMLWLFGRANVTP